PLGHRHQHDVHDHDAADDQAHGGDDDGDDVDAAGRALPEVHHRLAGLDAEVVGLGEAEVVAGTHDHPGLVLGGVHEGHGAGPGLDDDGAACTVELPPGGDGKPD